MLLKADPTFYPSPKLAGRAPAEKLAYVAALNANGGTRPNALLVVDVDSHSKKYGQIVGQVDMPNPGDELHHFGWNACSSALCPYAPHPHTSGPVVVTGNFTVDGAGNVTGGGEDINRFAGVQTNLSILATGSSYTVGSDNRGCVTLANSAGATTTFRFALGGCSTSANISGGCQNNGYFTRGRILDDDSATGTRATGIVRFADTSAFSSSSLSGMYAFGLRGWDFARGRYAMAGSASADSGSFTSVAADLNDNGVVAASLTGGSGTFNIQSNGRGTGSLSVGAASFDLVFYVVSSDEVILATVNQLDAAHPMLSGEVLSAPGPFTMSALQNTYMLRTAGLSQGAPDANVGVLSFDGVSAVKGTIYEDEGGTAITNSVAANYVLNGATGRLSFDSPVVPHQLAGYLVSVASGVSAFLISIDESAQAGVLEYQNANPAVTTFNDSALSGTYVLGTDESLDSNTWDYAGTVNPNGNGNQAGCLCDLSGPGVTGFIPNVQFLATYSVGKNGVGFFGGQTVSITSGLTTYYIDESPLNNHPAITVLEQ